MYTSTHRLTCINNTVKIYKAKIRHKVLIDILKLFENIVEYYFNGKNDKNYQSEHNLIAVFGIS